MFVPELLVNAVALIAVAFLVYIAWYDFQNLKIQNSSVLILLGLYAAWALLSGFGSITTDLAAAALLFVLGFVMWLLRLMGAGDVKLYFGLGLFMGLDQIGLFAILLLGATFLFLGVMFLAVRTGAEGGIAGRLRQIRKSGKAPYAVLMCASAIPATLLRVFAEA